MSIDTQPYSTQSAKEKLRDSGRLHVLVTYYGVVLLWLGTTAMHIPDGYLSPITSLVMFLLVLPFWVIGIRKIRQTMNARSVPLIALMAAFSFVIMMFNVPLPGGTTGHAVGAALAAIVLGPEIATIAVSIALIIQAFFFGDGGILAIGANCFNMAVVIPYIADAIYRVFSRNSRTHLAAASGWRGGRRLDRRDGRRILCRRRIWNSTAALQGGRRLAAVCALPAFGVHTGHGHSTCAGRLGGRGPADRAGDGLPAALERFRAGGGREARDSCCSRVSSGGCAGCGSCLAVLIVASPLGLAGARHGLGRMGSATIDRARPGFSSGRPGEPVRPVGRAAGRL